MKHRMRVGGGRVAEENGREKCPGVNLKLHALDKHVGRPKKKLSRQQFTYEHVVGC